MRSGPVFIIGAQRSGTTLLARVLATHPDALITVNGKLLYYLIVWLYRDSADAPGSHARLDEIAFSLQRKPILGLTEHEVQRMIDMLRHDFPPERIISLDARTIVRTVWAEIYRALAGTRRVLGDKYNEYLLQLTEICAVFPDARFVFLHRNPFDVAESMVRAFAGRPWAPTTPQAALAKWVAWNELWISLRERLPADRRVEVQYETLVLEPRRVLADICGFFEIASDAAFLDTAAQTINPDYVGRGSHLRSVTLSDSQDLVAVQRTQLRLGVIDAAR